MVVTPGFKMPLVALPLFQNLINIDQPTPKQDEHARPITALFGIYR
jgi:hypothetical protein